ncbi:MAG: preprotein translocase subunit SecG [Flavobacteriales bacterium]|nr:preprotein translocase subunit SecG [Flavobacteriales bacterium]
MVVVSVLIIIVAALLALVVLAQNPKGGGLAAGFTGAQQIGGVQRTADFLEKGTWTLAGALMVLCLVSAAVQGGEAAELDELDAPTEQVTSGEVAPEDVAPTQEEAPAQEPAPATP